MKRLISIVGIISIVVIWPAKLLAAGTNHIVISEIQTGSVSDASQEFIELYNPTSSAVMFENWIMEYASSAGTTWTKKATFSGTIPAYGFYLLAASGYLASDGSMTSGLATTAGHVRIKNSAGVVVDLVGWGSATHAEGSPVSAPIAGGSIERTPGRLSSQAGNGEDSDNNSNDFVAREVAEPQRISSPIENPALVPPEIVDPDTEDEGEVKAPIYLPIYITEVLPDPIPPLTDSRDEFIELFNPNDVVVNLKGYTIRTGSSFKSYYTIGDVSIAAGGYAAFYSVDTKLGLTNSGGAVQILDPLGTMLDVTDAYGTAKAGQAWANINGLWNWTLEATPGAANVLSEPTSRVAAAAVAKSTTKKVTVKKAAAKKAAVKKTSKATAKKTKAKTTKTGIAAATSAIADPSPLARWLLIGAGCFTIMYAIYGFRHDIYNYYIKSRRNLQTWIQDRPALPWRRNSRAGK